MTVAPVKFNVPLNALVPVDVMLPATPPFALITPVAVSVVLTCADCSVARPNVPSVVVCTSLALTSPVKSPKNVVVAPLVSITTLFVF